MKRRWESDGHSYVSSDDETSSMASEAKCLCIRNPLNGSANHPRQFPNSDTMSTTVTTSSQRGDGDAAMGDGEKMLAEEIKSLSLNEREQIFDDLHGVKPTLKETSELMEYGLQALDSQVKKIKNKDAYLKVAFVAPKLARDRGLKFMYLRSSNWEPHLAAKRYIKHFELKLELFGEKLLAKTIQWEDLPEDTQQSLQQGSFHMHEDFKDKSGRIVVVNSPAKWKYTSVVSHIKGMWYRNFSSPYSVESQRNGVIVVANFFDANSSCFSDSVQMAKYDFLDTMPIRVAGVHYIFPNTQLRPIFSFLLAAMPSDFRVRTKVHFGSMLECGYGLATYGIPYSMLPFDESGGFRYDIIGATLQKSKEEALSMEQAYLSDRPEPYYIAEVLSTDILLGRGTPYQKHQGNSAFIDWVKLHRDTCLLENQDIAGSAPNSRDKKSGLQDQVMAKLKTQGVRFLKKDKSGDWWVEVPESIAKDRVSMCLRNLSRRKT